MLRSTSVFKSHYLSYAKNEGVINERSKEGESKNKIDLMDKSSGCE